MKQLSLNLVEDEYIVESRVLLSGRKLNKDLKHMVRQHPESMLHHGNCFYYGKPFGANLTDLKIVVDLVSGRVVDGFIIRPRCWYDGAFGYQQNFGAALHWYSRSAYLECADAQYIFAEMYLHGHGLPKNPSEALRWFKKAAAGGHPLAQYRLVYVYDNEGQVRADNSEIVNLYRLEADKGVAEAQYELGMIHLRGDWVEKNYTLARNCFLKAAAQDHDLACYEAGLIYYEGLDIKKNLQKALKLFSTALTLRCMFANFMIRKIEDELSKIKTNNED